ncbi:U6 snRNA-associated Sm-like protein [Drechslerella dactyloides]|uniref:U6 snRNA-associated Sm-like protein n=1 Tax=Drechslerella dactyloides TaxID=74499 RepID=A0AAD6J733_DREDA|nr:U6 snRNA-associated Sm-like protein [Drechslerella dactyloides]
MDGRRGNYRGSSRGSGERGGRGGRGGYSNDRSYNRDSNHQGGGEGSGSGGGRGGREGGSGGQQHERPKKEAILDLAKYMDKRIIVKFSGGREVTGALKGYDQLMNLVLDEVKESVTDDQGTVQTRDLGLVVARGPLLVLISPVDGTEQIENPFGAPEEPPVI